MQTIVKGKAKFYKEGTYLFTADYEITKRTVEGDTKPRVDGAFYLSEQDRKNGEVLKWVQAHQYIIMQLDKTFEVADIKKDKLEVYPKPTPSLMFDGKCNFTPYLF